jgi:hypothetical protein
MMTLPPELARDFDQELERFEEEQKMSYVTSIERHGIEKGLQQGRLQTLRELVIEGLEARFGATPERLREQVLAIEDQERLRELHREAVVVASLAAFQCAPRRGSPPET